MESEVEAEAMAATGELLNDQIANEQPGPAEEG